MKIIAVVNQKGGVGKTTTTSHLAWGLARKGYRVLAIDFDPQGNLSEGMGANVQRETPTALEWLGISDRVAPFEKVVQRVSEGVDIIPANIYLDIGEELLHRELSRERILANKLKELRKIYDYVIIDCRPSLGLLTINALTAADELLVPVNSSYYSLPAVQQLIASVAKIKAQCNPAIKFNGFLLTMTDRRRNVEDYQDNFKALAGSVGAMFYSSSIRLAAAAADVSSYAKSLYSFQPNSNVSKDYLDFVEEFINKENLKNA